MKWYYISALATLSGFHSVHRCNWFYRSISTLNSINAIYELNVKWQLSIVECQMLNKNVKCQKSIRNTPFVKASLQSFSDHFFQNRGVGGAKIANSSDLAGDGSPNSKWIQQVTHWRLIFEIDRHCHIFNCNSKLKRLKSYFRDLLASESSITKGILHCVIAGRGIDLCYQE